MGNSGDELAGALGLMCLGLILLVASWGVAWWGLMYGWGLEPKSWPVIIGSAFFATLLALASNLIGRGIK